MKNKLQKTNNIEQLKNAYDKMRIEAISSRHNDSNFCTVIGLALLAEISFDEAHLFMEKAGRINNRGADVDEIMHGFKIAGLDVELKNLEKRFTVRKAPMVLPKGKYLLITCNHVVAMNNGIVQDFSKGSLRRVTQIIHVKPKPATIKEIRSLVMRTAWANAKQAAKEFGGSSKEYISLCMKAAWEEAKKYTG